MFTMHIDTNFFKSYFIANLIPGRVMKLGIVFETLKQQGE